MNSLFKIIFKTTDFTNVSIRNKAGKFTSFLGIGANILLFIMKLIIGLMTNSVAIISDAFNNLADSATSVLAIVGYHISSKPADKDHPFGHGRAEYLASFVIGLIIIFVGFTLGKTSFDKFFNPDIIIFSYLSAFILIISILVKAFLSLFNSRLGKLCDSSIMKSIAKDAFNDILATSIALIALISSTFTDFPVDSIGGIIVSLFVINAGYSIIQETMDELLGKNISDEEKTKLTDYLMNYDRIKGVHDIILHSYGVNNIMGSVHVEVSSNEQLLEIHELIDEIERCIKRDFKMDITLHIDPIEEDNEVIIQCKELINTIINEMDLDLTYHDFRVVKGINNTNIVFDLEVPFECKKNVIEIKEEIDNYLHKQDKVYYAIITFDYK